MRNRKPKKLWYVVQVSTGKDRSVAREIRRRVVIEDCSDLVGRVMTPVRLVKSTKLPPRPKSPTLLVGREVTIHEALATGRRKAWELCGEPPEPRSTPEGYHVRVKPSKGKEKGKVGNWWEWEVTKPGPRKGRERVIDTEDLMYPGYVIVHMRMTDFGFDLVNGVRGVETFLCTSGKPAALETEEAARILVEQMMVHKQQEAGKSVKLAYGIGDKVRVTDGPFAKLEGKVLKIAGEVSNPVVGVEVNIIGRAVPVELSHWQCQPA